MSSFLNFEDVLKFSLGIAWWSFSAMGEGAGLLIGFILYKLSLPNKDEAKETQEGNKDENATPHFQGN